ncbi:MAG: c-type cytochrome [Burkholderiales bacterium]|nr:MAG: c-type cytochrome [Burkholderiales bacterium]
MRSEYVAAIAASLVIATASFASAQAVSAQEPEPTQEVATSGDADAGGELYATECRGCHSVSIAPSLRGIIDRPAASVAAFSGYSAALKAKSDITWTEANLDVFLSDPQAFAPGALMTKSIGDAQQRADIIAYLATLPPPRQ